MKQQGRIQHYINIHAVSFKIIVIIVIFICIISNAFVVPLEYHIVGSSLIDYSLLMFLIEIPLITFYSISLSKNKYSPFIAAIALGACEAMNVIVQRVTEFKILQNDYITKNCYNNRKT
ncbi:MAG: hypothetical protein J6Y82_05105 [Bacteroidales bacterium]|nr:hypothetical protein [Bacteroidales bacterium]